MPSETLAPRFGRARFFAGLSDREEGRAGGLQLGLTTYGVDEATGRDTYQVSYLEWSGRSDHLSDLIDQSVGRTVTPQFVDESGDDVAYVGTPEMNSQFRADSKGTTSTSTASEAEVKTSLEVVA